MSPPEPVPKSRAASAWEVAAVVATALLHLVVSNAWDRQALFIATALPAWALYAIGRARRDPRVLDRWGFTRRGLGPTVRATGLLVVVAGIGMALYARAEGHLVLDARILPLLLLYPALGLIQQFLVQALVAGNLRRLDGPLSRAGVVVPTCALLFGLVHLPDGRLALATFALRYGTR